MYLCVYTHREQSGPPQPWLQRHLLGLIHLPPFWQGSEHTAEDTSHTLLWMPMHKDILTLCTNTSILEHENIPLTLRYRTYQKTLCMINTKNTDSPFLPDHPITIALLKSCIRIMKTNKVENNLCPTYIIKHYSHITFIMKHYSHRVFGRFI